ncbi:MAG: nucleotide exchange factor GrpE [Spirochaetia bacterium]|jgi:molecular chaperone GrpE|nr:nucleotide exchange factor GrpE [Spirochaetia bacterium]
MSEDIETKKDGPLDHAEVQSKNIPGKEATGKGKDAEGVMESEKEDEVKASKAKKKQQKELEKKDAEIAELKKKIEALSAELTENKDHMLRRQADMENFRKRLVKEKEEAVKYANARLIEDLLQPLDDFERAIHAAEASRDFDTIHDGVVMVNDKMLSILEKNWGLKKIECVGQEFDPSKHEAYLMEEDEKYHQETVIQELGAGYTLHDRVIRPAKVKVGKPV